MTEAQAPRSLYWAGALLLILFGTLTGFSIGIPFLMVGLSLVVLAPFQGRRQIFVPAVAAMVAFFAGFILVAPLGCTSTMTVTDSPRADGVASSVRTTVCDNVLGIDYSYSGEGLYNPPLWPGAVAGLAVAAVAATTTWLLLESRRTDRTNVA